MRTDEVHAVYRFFDSEGKLLYVGLTSNPGARWSSHEKEKPWWHTVATVTVERQPTLADAVAVEAAAIRNEHPLHNIAHATTEQTERAREALSEQADRHSVSQEHAKGERERLRELVREAVVAGVTESEAARLSGMSRLTVRAWLGK